MWFYIPTVLGLPIVEHVIGAVHVIGSLWPW